MNRNSLQQTYTYHKITLVNNNQTHFRSTRVLQRNVSWIPGKKQAGRNGTSRSKRPAITYSGRIARWNVAANIYHFRASAYVLGDLYHAFD
jgi:hypothetical protein